MRFMDTEPRTRRHLTPANDVFPGAERIANVREQVSVLATALADLQRELEDLATQREPDIAPLALTPTQAAKALGVSRATLYRVDPPFPRLNIGGVVRVPVWWIEQFAAGQQAS